MASQKEAWTCGDVTTGVVLGLGLLDTEKVRKRKSLDSVLEIPIPILITTTYQFKMSNHNKLDHLAKSRVVL